LSTELAAALARLEGEARQAAGVAFNLASPKQLGELLFDTLGLDRKKSRKTKTGWSTDAAVLEKLDGDHPVVSLVLEHRTLSKLRSTYVEALPVLVEPETGRVHTDFNQAVTATGRLSSSNPNLQNIPIRTEFSRRIRKAFLPQAGWQLISADYSQIELRILTHLSGEPVLVEAYKSGDDVHALTARLLLEKDEVTADERRLGKTINFGVIYGMGAQRFARETGVATRSVIRVCSPSWSCRNGWPSAAAMSKPSSVAAAPFTSIQAVWVDCWARIRWRSISRRPAAPAWRASNCGRRPMHRSRAPVPTSSR
jgi:DNA polymerase-1